MFTDLIATAITDMLWGKGHLKLADKSTKIHKNYKEEYLGSITADIEGVLTDFADTNHHGDDSVGNDDGSVPLEPSECQTPNEKAEEEGNTSRSDEWLPDSLCGDDSFASHRSESASSRSSGGSS